MKAIRPSFTSGRSSRKPRGGATRTASVAISACHGNGASDGRHQRAGVVVERELLRVDVSLRRLIDLEPPRPAASTARGDAALEPRGADDNGDVQVTPAELRVDDLHRERDR